jgi:hypothetical protein
MLLLSPKARIVNNNYWAGKTLGMKVSLVGSFCGFAGSHLGDATCGAL